MKKFFSSAIMILLVSGVLVPAFQTRTARAQGALFVPDSYSTIQAAIDAAVSGDVIFVRAGTYGENLIINKTLVMVSPNIDPHSTIIDGNSTGDVVSIEADNVQLIGFTIQHSGGFPFSGINVENSGSCNIQYNILISNYDALNLNNCSKCIIQNNAIDQATRNGIGIISSHDNLLLNNTIADCSNQGIETALSAYNNTIQSNILEKNAGGILIVDSYQNTIFDNSIIQNMIGIWLQHSQQNRIFQNQLNSNTIGMELFDSDSFSNHIYHNNIVNSTYSQAGTSGQKGNFWDNGYPSGGNYWSDYNDTDLQSGAYQNETGSDGIGDTSYTIDSNNIDNYPLMNPYVKVHTILSVEPQNLTVKPNENFTVTIILSNITHDNAPAGLVGIELALTWNTTLLEPLSFSDELGKTDGVFNGSRILYAPQAGFFSDYPNPYPSTRIAEPGPYNNAVCYFVVAVSITNNGVILLPWWGSGVVANITFQANSTVTSPTNSTLQLVSTEILDNNAEGITLETNNSTVLIQPTGPGDLNNDGKVSLADLIIVAEAYGSRPGDPNWNPAADIAAPFGIISLTDLVTVAVHYGQHYT